MLKTKAQLECSVNDKTAHFYCDHDTPLAVVKEMLFQFQKFIGQIEDRLAKDEEEKKQQENPEAQAPVEQPVEQPE